MLNHYEVLGVEPTADPAEVRRAWRVKVRLLHPDIHQGAPDDVQAEAAAETVRVNQAWETLRDADKRHQYDLHLLAQRDAASHDRRRERHSPPKDGDNPSFDVPATCSVCHATQRVSRTAGRFDCASCKMAWQFAKCEGCAEIAQVRERSTSWRCASCGRRQSSTWGGAKRYVFCGRCKSPTVVDAGVEHFECAGCRLDHLRCICGHYEPFPSLPWLAWRCKKCKRVNRVSSRRSFDLAQSVFVIVAVCCVVIGLVLLAGLAQ